MSKKWFLSLSLALAIMLPMAGSAFTVNDVVSISPYTQAEVWVSGQQVGNGYAGSGTFQDSVGYSFATDKMVINLNPFTIEIFTNNRPGGWVISGKNWGVADIAINADAAKASYNGYTQQHFGNISAGLSWASICRLMPRIIKIPVMSF